LAHYDVRCHDRLALGPQSSGACDHSHGQSEAAPRYRAKKCSA
jgi:hypothetical protein